MTRGTEIIGAVAQQSFWNNENQFTTVLPLAEIEGDRLLPVDAPQYPNRGLVWWMVRGQAQREVIPGRLVVGYIEEAERFDPTAPDKDKFQLVWDTAKLGGPKNLIEIIGASDSLEPRDLINRPGSIKLDHPPTSLVLVQISGRLYGPFRAECDTMGVRFAISLTKPQTNATTLVFDATDVQADPGYMTFDQVDFALDAQPINRSREVGTASYQLLTWGRFEELQAQAVDRIELYTDEETVRQAAKQVLSRKRLKVFMEEWTDIRNAYLGSQPDSGSQTAARIFEAIDSRLSVAGGAVEDLVQGLIESGVLDPRVESAIEERVQRYLDSNTAKLSSQVEERLRELRREEEELNKRKERLANDIDRRRRQEEQRLNADLEAKREDFETLIDRERADLERMRQELDTGKHLLEASLNEASNRFQTNREELLRDFLSLTPFLTQLGHVGGERPANPVQEALQSEPTLRPPAFLSALGAEKGIESETEFFERFKGHVDNCGFRYRLLDLISLHLSIKCGDLTILGGWSGTGKSSLPVLYAQAMAGSADRLLSVDVSPAWLEPGDVLGRVNLLEEKFHPAATGLFETLVWAAMEAEQVGADSAIWLISLDELNLAQPEHYFSGFLQALARSGDQRRVGVFSPSAVRRDDPWRDWYRLPLHTNLRFVGTVNYDETTKPLSQRLRDRANELQIEATPVGGLYGTASTAISAPVGLPVTVASFEAWIREAPLSGQAAEVIDAIQQPLRVLGSPLTPRRSQAIARFVASARDLCTADQAFDLQLRQRVLNQIRGVFRPEARRAMDELALVLSKYGSAYEGAHELLTRIREDARQGIDFDALVEES